MVNKYYHTKLEMDFVSPTKYDEVKPYPYSEPQSSVFILMNGGSGKGENEKLEDCSHF